jgi:hypothetical protein
MGYIYIYMGAFKRGVLLWEMRVVCCEIFVASNNKEYRTHMDCLRGLYFRLNTQLISKLIIKSNQNIYHGFKQ